MRGILITCAACAAINLILMGVFQLAPTMEFERMRCATFVIITSSAGVAAAHLWLFGSFLADLIHEVYANNLVKKAKQGNFIPLAKRIIKHRYDYTEYIESAKKALSEEEKISLKNVCLNLIYMQPKNTNNEKAMDYINRILS